MWQLIPHLNLDAQRLMMLITAVVACFQDGKKNRHLPALNGPLRLAIWNFIRDYPAEFRALSGAQKGELSREACTRRGGPQRAVFVSFCLSNVYLCHQPTAGFAERLFDICETYSDNARKKAQLWPLQNMLLMLCPVRLLAPPLTATPPVQL